MSLLSMSLIFVFLVSLLVTGVSAGSSDADSLGLALIAASGEGDLVKMRNLLSSGALATAKNEFGETALHTACIKADPKVIELLLEAGGEVNTPSDGVYPGHEMRVQRTPLMWCIHARDNIPAVKALLAAGAKITTIQSEEGETALEMTLAMGAPARQSGLVDLLLDHATAQEGYRLSEL